MNSDHEAALLFKAFFNAVQQATIDLTPLAKRFLC